MPKKKSTSEPADYLRAPFEVRYSILGFTTFELMSAVPNIKKPSDFKGINEESGNAYGVTFKCEKNNGPELMCCLTGSHGQTCPDWLEIVDEDDQDINYEEVSGFVFTDRGLYLDEETPEDSYDLRDTSYCCKVYYLKKQIIDHIVFDLNGELIQIDKDGYSINKSGKKQLIIDVEKLKEDKSLTKFSTKSVYQAQDEWIEAVWKEAFPKLPVPKIINHA